VKDVAIVDSFVSGLDPRAKIVSIFAFSSLAAVSNRFPVLFLLLLMSVGMATMTRAPLSDILKRMIPVNVLVLFLWFFLPFTFAGETFFSIGPLTLAREGVIHASRISIKSNAIMLALVSLVLSTSIADMGRAMFSLGIHKKIVHLFFFTYRYIHVIHKEYNSLLWAVKIRGFAPKNSRRTYQTFAWLIGMTLVKSFDRAHRVYNAMLCRGFDGRLYGINEFSIKKTDVAVMMISLAATVALGALEWSITPIF